VRLGKLLYNTTNGSKGKPQLFHLISWKLYKEVKT